MGHVLKFKTNLNCHGCKSSVASYLNEIESITNWDLDLNDDDKVLTVYADGITSDDLIKIIKKAGYHAESMIIDNHKCH